MHRTHRTPSPAHPKPKLLALVLATALALSACGGGSEAPAASTSSDTQSTSSAPADVSTEPANADTSSGDQANSGPLVVDGPNGFALQIEEFGEIANWNYTNIVTAKVCAELQADRTLRIYRSMQPPSASDEATCDNGGGSLLTFETTRDLETLDPNVEIQIIAGDTATISAEGNAFAVSGTGIATIEVSSTDDPSMPPAILNVAITANTGQLTLAFSGPTGS